jgi:hypothetical protein
MRRGDPESPGLHWSCADSDRIAFGGDRYRVFEAGCRSPSTSRPPRSTRPPTTSCAQPPPPACSSRYACSCKPPPTSWRPTPPPAQRLVETALGGAVHPHRAQPLRGRRGECTILKFLTSAARSGQSQAQVLAATPVSARRRCLTNMPLGKQGNLTKWAYRRLSARRRRGGSRCRSDPWRRGRTRCSSGRSISPLGRPSRSS